MLSGNARKATPSLHNRQSSMDCIHHIAVAGLRDLQMVGAGCTEHMVCVSA